MERGGGERLAEEGEREEEEGERKGRKERSAPRGDRGGANKDKQRIRRGEGQRGVGQGVRAAGSYIPVASSGDNCRHSLFVKCYKRMPQNRVTGTARVTHLCASPSRTGGTHAKREGRDVGGKGAEQTRERVREERANKEEGNSESLKKHPGKTA